MLRSLKSCIASVQAWDFTGTDLAHVLDRVKLELKFNIVMSSIFSTRLTALI